MVWIKAALPTFLFRATTQKPDFSTHHASMLPLAGGLSIHIAPQTPGFKVVLLG